MSTCEWAVFIFILCEFTLACFAYLLCVPPPDRLNGSTRWWNSLIQEASVWECMICLYAHHRHHRSHRNRCNTASYVFARLSIDSRHTSNFSSPSLHQRKNVQITWCCTVYPVPTTQLSSFVSSLTSLSFFDDFTHHPFTAPSGCSFHFFTLSFGGTLWIICLVNELEKILIYSMPPRCLHVFIAEFWWISTHLSAHEKPAADYDIIQMVCVCCVVDADLTARQSALFAVLLFKCMH